MGFRKYAVTAAALAFGSSLSATNDEVTFGPAPDWVVESEPMAVPDDQAGLIFLRRNDLIVHLSDDGQHLYQGQLVRILRSQGLQVGNVGIVWNPAAGTPKIHELKVHRDGEVIDILSKAEFEILRREDQLETAVLDGMLTAVLRVPDLRVGDDLEFNFTVPSHDPTFKDRNFGVLMLNQAPPSGRLKLALNWTDGQQPKTALTEDLIPNASKGAHEITLKFDNAETLSPLKDAPPRYNWMRILQYSDFESWGEISRQFSPLFERASELAANSSVKTEAARIAKQHPTQLERAQAALKLVQQEVRYIYVGLNGGNLSPASAEETWERRYGDCKGKTALLLALLRELGIQAEAVLANNAGNDDGLDTRLPSPGMFDHVLVRASIGGKNFWLDGTLPEIVGAREAPFLPYRWVLPLSEKGEKLAAVGAPSLELPQEMGITEIDVRAGFNEPAKRKQTTVKRGVMGLAEYMQFSAIAPEQLHTALRDAYISGGYWYEVEDVEYRYDRKTMASILSVTGTGPVDWDDEGDGRFDLSLPGGGFSPPSRRQRPAGQHERIPFYSEPEYSCHVTTVLLPEDTDLENWGYNSTFDTMMFGRAYYRMIQKAEDRTIRMVRGSKVIDVEIDAERAKRDNERIADFDNSMAWIKYNPMREFEPWGNIKPVPATFEIDWTGPNVPCLPKDLIDID